MPAADGLEAELLAVLRDEFGHVSAERVLSGPGLANLHRGLARLHGRPEAPLGPDEITRLALAGGDDLCRLALERSEEHTSEIQSLMRNSYAVFCLQKKT